MSIAIVLLTPQQSWLMVRKKKSSRENQTHQYLFSVFIPLFFFFLQCWERCVVVSCQTVKGFSDTESALARLQLSTWPWPPAMPKLLWTKPWQFLDRILQILKMHSSISVIFFFWWQFYVGLCRFIWFVVTGHIFFVCVCHKLRIIIMALIGKTFSWPL